MIIIAILIIDSILTFNTYFKFDSSHKNNLTLPLTIVPKSSRLRTLDDNINALCLLDESSQNKLDNLDIYKCNAIYTREIENVN